MEKEAIINAISVLSEIIVNREYKSGPMRRKIITAIKKLTELIEDES